MVPPSWWSTTSSGPTDLLAEAPTRLTSRTLTPAGLRKELAAAREGGIARERDEAVPGESSVAGAIFEHSGHAVGASEWCATPSASCLVAPRAGSPVPWPRRPVASRGSSAGAAGLPTDRLSRARLRAANEGES